MGRDLSTLLSARKSVRGFQNRPVDLQEVRTILRLARSAPSSANLQPGRFHVLSGGVLDDLRTDLQHAAEAGRPQVSEFSYFPTPMGPENRSRRRLAGQALYMALGITRRDIAGRKLQFSRNYAFFSAPVGIVVTIERQMGKGCFMDLGMSIMALLCAAEERGLATCCIGALANHADVVHAMLGLPPDEMVVCGVALGYEDDAHPANSVKTARDDLDSFATFRGFS